MRERLRVTVRGAVQGVGFRPFVYRLARELGLDGFVMNSPLGVAIEVEGDAARLGQCLLRIDHDRPPRAVIQSLESSWLDAVPYAGFEIRQSAQEGMPTALVLPDVATCGDCRREIFDPANRRYRYPFTNCTNCGPRFSIIEGLPYDRTRTSMRAFTMCPACQREYDDPDDRRFHAQPNACPACGPRLALWDSTGAELAGRDDALRASAAALREGRIVAVKGLGGFHFMVDASNASAVARLRERKHREEKPFALMYARLADVIDDCQLSAAEARLLESPECPIVLLRRRDPSVACRVVPAVAPRNPYLGVMLPCTPLHHLLLAEVGGPVVATSGNLSDEPMATDEQEALDRLGSIADLFLVHDRPIVRHMDDSIACVMLGRELVTRRARGYAPLPVPLGREAPPMVAVGAHQKSAVALTAGSNVFISQHIGDLESVQSTAAFKDVLRSLQTLYQISPTVVAADLHPDYLSTKHAATLGVPIVRVQHHHAHVAACMAENEIEGTVLGVAWDGTGYGPDGTIWGGEFLLCDGGSFTRAACLRPFRLPGGDRAAREPRRSALGLLHAMGRDGVGTADGLMMDAFALRERELLLQALDRGLNAAVTTSAGRLFDAVAAIVGLRARASFEGQAAMELEFSVDDGVDDAYPFTIDERVKQYSPGPSWTVPGAVIDWEPTIRAILADVRHGSPVGAVSARFHNTLADMIVATAAHVAESRVVLTGGCFQNRYLTTRAVTRLRQAGFRPYWHQRVPPNDGGIALGQIAASLSASTRAAHSRATSVVAAGP
jgi:hydrogenase maturation protein HypF